MIEALFNFIISLFFWLIGIIGSLVIYPIQLLIVTIFPTLGEFLTTTTNFLTQQIFPIIALIKEVVKNIAVIPDTLWNIYIGFIIAIWAILPALRGIKLIINIWKIKSGGATK